MDIREALISRKSIRSYKPAPISLAIAYPDWDFPANRVKSRREPVANLVTWCGFA